MRLTIYRIGDKKKFIKAKINKISSSWQRDLRKIGIEKSYRLGALTI